MDLLDDDALLDLRDRKRRTDPEAVIREERAARRPAPAMNEALADFSSARASAEPVDRPASDLCGLCGERPAKLVCASCGRHCCSADSWVMLHLCKDCAKQERVEKAKRRVVPSKKNWLEDA